MFKKLISKVQKGFTPVELLILIGISAVFAGVIIFTATAPAKPQLAQGPAVIINTSKAEVASANVAKPQAVAQKLSRTPSVHAEEFPSDTLVVYPVGDPTQDQVNPYLPPWMSEYIPQFMVTKDLVNVFNAVNSGGTVILKATNEAGVPTPFEFGEVVYDMFHGYERTSAPDPVTYFPPLLDVMVNKHVEVYAPVDIKGETVNGHQTTILHGGDTFVVYADADVAIEGIRFEDFYEVAVLNNGLSEGNTLTVKNNKFVQHLNAYFADVSASPTSFYPPSEAGYVNPYEPVAAPDSTSPIYQDFMTWLNSPVPADTAKAASRFFYDDMIGWRDSAVWGVGGSGRVVMENNTVDFEEGIDANMPSKEVWWLSWGIITGGDFGGTSEINNNTIMNASYAGIGAGHGAGNISIQKNFIKMGPVGHQWNVFGFALPWSGMGIVTGNMNPFGGDSIYVANNKIFAKDHNLGIGAIGMFGNTFSMNAIGNEINMTNSDTGMFLADISDANIARNKFIGSAERGIWAGFSDDWGFFPLNSDSNAFVANQMSNLNASSSAVYLNSDANHNTFVGGKGTVIDFGTDNVFKGDYRTIAGEKIHTPGGVGSVVSKTANELNAIKNLFGTITSKKPKYIVPANPAKVK